MRVRGGVVVFEGGGVGDFGGVVVEFVGVDECVECVCDDECVYFVL